MLLLSTNHTLFHSCSASALGHLEPVLRAENRFGNRFIFVVVLLLLHFLMWVCAVLFWWPSSHIIGVPKNTKNTNRITFFNIIFRMGSTTQHSNKVGNCTHILSRRRVWEFDASNSNAKCHSRVHTVVKCMYYSYLLGRATEACSSLSLSHVLFSFSLHLFPLLPLLFHCLKRGTILGCLSVPGTVDLNCTWNCEYVEQVVPHERLHLLPLLGPLQMRVFM